MVDFRHFWSNFEHFLTAFISRFLEKDQLPSRLRIISRSAFDRVVVWISNDLTAEHRL